MDSPQEITLLLLAWERGDREALERLLPLVEQELRRLACGYLRKEAKGHSLQTTELVNQAFLKLLEQNRVHWKNRAHFFGVAAICMRRVVLDYVKAKKREKRGAGIEHVALSDAPAVSDEQSVGLMALDEALQELTKQDERKGRIVEMRFFGGYSVEEISESLKISPRTVEREWHMARAWLRRELDTKPKAGWLPES